MNDRVSQIQPAGSVRDRLERPVRDLRISVIDRCNYRCPYCMPEELFGEGHEFLPRKHWLTPGEIKRIASLFVGLGVTKLRLTGGEPLLRRDITEIVAGLTEIAGVEDLALTTNASRLGVMARELRSAGLQRVTVSLDSLDQDVFATMNGGRGDVATVLGGIDAALAAGFDPVKVNVMVQRGVNDHTVLDLLEHFRGTGVIVRFIEYMDVGSLNGWQPEDVVPSAELHARISERWSLEALSQNYSGEVANRYRFADGSGEIGFISSVSEPFCGDCHRARVSADGTLYTCLFAHQGTNLRNFMRAGASDADMTGLLQNLWRNRNDRYSEVRGRFPAVEARVEMYRMGG
ncbi:MAG: GTP 3',8-cyclase MoaA [Gammaproteobacteria bacterium]|jgi:cyclic pyranopterin phosphate synthase